MLRADCVTQRELWIEYFPSADCIDNDYIEKLQQKQKEKVIEDTKKAISDKYKQENEEKRCQQIAEAKDRAHKYARDKRKKFITISRTILVAVFVVIALGCIIGLFKLLSSLPISAFLIAFAFISVLSIIDTLTSRGKYIGTWIEKRANYYETTEYEKKLKEYMQLLE